MHPKLKLKIYEAIEGAINTACEEEDAQWEGFIDPDLTNRMMKAAALVFDSCMEGQRYAKQEES